eukprot:31494-Pelagococcus_subviridis.AAC.16
MGRASASCSSVRSHASGSPGEHGTYRSSPSGPVVVLKCVASCVFRTGSYRTSLTTWSMSLPLNPSLCAPSD